MTDRRDAVVAMGWEDIRELAPSRAIGGSTQTTLGASELHRTSAGWWPRAAVHDLCVREGGEVWLHVVSGEVEIERWSRDEDGAWRASPTRLRAGGSERLGAGALHRAQARQASSVIVVCSPPDAISPDAGRATLAMLRRGREAMESDVLLTTSVDIASPRDHVGGDEDA